MVEILTSQGYRVLQAANGYDGMRVFQEHSQHITLALLDVLMPGCSGIELAKGIRKLNPELPIIFVTGYDKKKISSHNELLGDIEVFTKPVCIELLIETIERISIAS